MWIMLSQISPAARTSACSACGSNVPTVPAVSSGVHVEFEGDIEVCRRCIVEAAVMFGMVEAARLTDSEAEVAELRAWADTAYDELSARQRTIETISAALATTASERDALAALLNGEGSE